MFTQYPLNLKEEQKNLMINKFHNTNLVGGKSFVIFVFLLSVSVRHSVTIRTHVD
jgi:hypothetical protein